MAPDESGKARNRVVDYEQTVKALLAFAAFVVHDGTGTREDSQFGFGRRMTTSDDNAVAPRRDVTPDLVAQKSTGYGVVAEIKKSLAQDQNTWARHLLQLRKYDDALLGWWTTSSTIPSWNAVMLMHQSRSRAFLRYLESNVAAKSEAVGPNACLIEFNSSEETSRFFFFRLEWGEIRDVELAQRLRNGVPVPLDKVLASFPNIKYYDSPPPLELLLTQLWTDVFPAMAAEVELDEMEGVRKIAASVTDISHELQIAYGSGALYTDERAAGFPHASWVKRALEALVSYKLAVPPVDGGDVYLVRYRGFRKDVLERFIELANRGAERAPETQLSLLPEEAGDLSSDS